MHITTRYNRKSQGGRQRKDVAYHCWGCQLQLVISMRHCIVDSSEVCRFTAYIYCIINLVWWASLPVNWSITKRERERERERELLKANVDSSLLRRENQTTKTSRILFPWKSFFECMPLPKYRKGFSCWVLQALYNSWICGTSYGRKKYYWGCRLLNWKTQIIEFLIRSRRGHQSL